LDAAQKGANALVGKSEQMAGHAGLGGVPYANPAGYPRHTAPVWPRSGGDPQPAGPDEEQASDDNPTPPPTPPSTVSAPPVMSADPSPVQHERPPPARVIESDQPEQG
jgi:hypothetical protein